MLKQQQQQQQTPQRKNKEMEKPITHFYLEPLDICLESRLPAEKWDRA